MPRGRKKEAWLPQRGWFWEKINKNGPIQPHMSDPCWVWTAHKGKHGYGKVQPTTRPERAVFAVLLAHRVAWELEVGEIPADKIICHHCDFRSCVRPSHLFLGTDQANFDDMRSKGRERRVRGASQHLSKLDDQAIREIRTERQKSPPTLYRVLAERFGVTPAAVRFAAIGITWKHVV